MATTTFAIVAPDTLDTERVGKDGTVYYPKTWLNLLQRQTMFGCQVWSCDRDTARQFPTRATAEKFRRATGRSDYRVIRIAVESLRED